MSNQLSFPAGSGPIRCEKCHSTEETVRRDREFLRLKETVCCRLRDIINGTGRRVPSGYAVIGNGLYCRVGR